MKPKLILVLALMLSALLFNGFQVTRADLALGVDSYVANAAVIETVRSQNRDEIKSFPPSPGQQRVVVEEVLKGVDTAQEYLVPEGKLGTNQRAVVLFESPPPPFTRMLPAHPPQEPDFLLWTFDAAGRLDTHNVPPTMEDWFTIKRWMERGYFPITNLDLIRRGVATNCLEYTGLGRQVSDAVLFPANLEELARTNRHRSDYVHLVIAILDFDRNVPMLANLLESTDPAVRAAAVSKLHAATGSSVPSPRGQDAVSLHDWAEAWSKQTIPDPPVRWPPLPSNQSNPPDAFPDPLLRALDQVDGSAFAGQFALWLDSGALRDREVGPSLIPQPYSLRNVGYANLFTNGGVFLSTQLSPELLFDTNVTAAARMKAIAMVADVYQYSRFTKERTDAARFLRSTAASEDMLRRAAYWEPHRSYDTNDLRHIALARLTGSGDVYAPISTSGPQAELNRLARCDAPDTQQFLLGLCLHQQLDDCILNTVRIEARAGREIFVDGLYAYLNDHRDDKARWIGRMLCVEKQMPAVPIMMSWLKDGDAEVRAAGAFNLCWSPSAIAVPALLDAIQSETNTATKKQMLEALAQTDDERALDMLLAAAHDDGDKQTLADIARGLGRIRDPKALPTLADMVSGLMRTNESFPPKDENLLSDAANAFGYITHFSGAHAPDPFWTASGINLEQVKREVDAIQQWQKSQSGKP